MKILNKTISPIIVIYVVSIFMALLWIVLFGPIIYNDTPGYLAAYSDSLSLGKISSFRTPLYPSLLGLSRDMFGPNIFPWVIIVLQYVVFLISVRFFYLSAQKLLPNLWALIITAFYAVYPTFGSWSNMLLTESLELSLSVFLMYSCIRLIMDNNEKHTVGIFVWLILLLSLRPSSVAFLPALFVTFAIMFFIKDKRKSSVLGIFCIAAVSLALLGYSAEVKKQTGLFTPSTVSVYNNYWIAHKYGYLNKELDLNTVDVVEVQSVVKESIRNNKKGWVIGLARRTYDASLMPSLTSYTSQLFRVHPLYPINIGIILLLLIVYILLFFPTYRRRLPPDSYLLVFISGSIVLLSIVGAQYEWNRLILPAQPMILIMVAQIIIKTKNVLALLQL